MQTDDEKPRPHGAKSRAVSAALIALWPPIGRPPETLTAKDRDTAVRDWIIDGGHSLPNDIPKAVRRALADQDGE